MNTEQPILILGGGKMGGALAVRWHTARLAPIHVVEHDEARRYELGEFGIATHASLADVPTDYSVLVLAIKPQQFLGMVSEIKAHASNNSLVISIMAGISIAALQQISRRAVRAMPNLPALIGESMTGAYASKLDADDRTFVAELFGAVGQFAWVENEELLHAVTAISGSGPAYLFAFMEALQAAAIGQGLSPATAHQLVMQTMRGSALLADQSEEDVATLRRNVTSPGGTTEAALAAFTSGKLNALVDAAVDAAAKRSAELAK